MQDLQKIIEEECSATICICIKARFFKFDEAKIRRIFNIKSQCETMKKLTTSLATFLNDMIIEENRVYRDNIEYEDKFPDLHYQHSIGAKVYIYKPYWADFDDDTFYKDILHVKLAKNIKRYEDEDVAVFTI